MIEFLNWWSANPFLGIFLIVGIVMALNAIFEPLANAIFSRRSK